MVTTLRQAFAVVEPYLVSVPLSGGQWLMAACSGREHVASAGDCTSAGAALAGLRAPALKVVTSRTLAAMLHLLPYLAQALSLPA